MPAIAPPLSRPKVLPAAVPQVFARPAVPVAPTAALQPPPLPVRSRPIAPQADATAGPTVSMSKVLLPPKRRPSAASPSLRDVAFDDAADEMSSPPVAAYSFPVEVLDVPVFDAATTATIDGVLAAEPVAVAADAATDTEAAVALRSSSSTDLLDGLPTQGSGQHRDLLAADVYNEVDELDAAPASAQQPFSHSMLVVEDDDDDDFFPSNTRVTPPKAPVQFSRSASTAPNHLEQVKQTPQPLRQLFAVSDVDGELPPEFAASQPEVPQPEVPQLDVLVAEAAPAVNVQTDSSDVTRIAAKEMDFTVDPIDFWYEREEAARVRERERMAAKRASVRLSTETLERLSRPKRAAGKQAAPSQIVTSPGVTEKSAGSYVQQTVGEAASGVDQPLPQHSNWSVPLQTSSAERPNETHCYFRVHSLHTKHLVAVHKKTTFVTVAERLQLPPGELRLHAAKGAASVLRWDDTPASLGLSSGIGNAVVLKHVSQIEIEEEIIRERITSEMLTTSAHHVAFSEWVLRCSDRLSRHIFFDAAGDFEDLEL